MQKTLNELVAGTYVDSEESSDNEGKDNDGQDSETPSYFSDTEEEDSYRRYKDAKKRKQAAKATPTVKINKGSLEQ